MPGPLENLRYLRDDMIQHGWVVTCFPFSYKGRSYFVLPQRYVPPRTAPEYALVELTIADQDDLARTLTAPANSMKIDVTAQRLREYFGIEWSPNLRDLLAQFSAQLGSVVPPRVPERLTSEEQLAAVQQLDRGSNEDPGKLYCYGTRRNPDRADGDLGQRSQFNSQKTELLRPDLYAKLRQDQNISFCYSVDPTAERTDEQILARFDAS